MSEEGQAKGRQNNAAQPLGARPGLVKDKGAKLTGRQSRHSAGPDGPDAKAVGDTFKR